MDIFQKLRELLGGGQPQQRQQVQQPVKNKVAPGMQPRDPRSNPNDPASQGYAPEITWNPNPNTNIPYSTHNQADVTLGNEYTADPTNAKFLGVDPARFGYPEDISQYGGNQQMQQPYKNPIVPFADLLKRKY